MEEVAPPPINDDQQLPPAFQEFGYFVFLFNDLPLNVPEVEIDGEDQPDRRNDVGNLAATYMLPLQIVLTSLLSSYGSIRAIYVNFGPKGYYKFNPRSSLLVGGQEQFTALLAELFEKEVIRDGATNEVLRHKITEPSSLLANLYATSRMVGCLDGNNESIGAITSIEDYLRNASPSPEEPIVFVVGRVLGHEIESHIHDYVRVYESKLKADVQLPIIMDAAEDKLSAFQ